MSNADLARGQQGGVKVRISEVKIKPASFPIAPRKTKKTRPTVLRNLIGCRNLCMGSGAVAAIDSGMPGAKSGEDFISEGASFLRQGIDTVIGTDELHH